MTSDIPLHCCSFVVGVIVGSGIFATPGQVLLNAGSVGLTLLAWVAAGVVALFSSFIYAELGSAIPHAGGDSEYLRVSIFCAWSDLERRDNTLEGLCKRLSHSGNVFSFSD